MSAESVGGLRWYAFENHGNWWVMGQEGADLLVARLHLDTTGLADAMGRSPDRESLAREIADRLNGQPDPEAS